MCVSVRRADFKGTYECLNLTLHPVTGEEVFVLIYQNIAVSLETAGGGANAMLLHLPSATRVTQANFVDTTGFSHVLKDMQLALEPPTRSFGITAKGGLTRGYVEVFELGIYHVVLAQDARDIPNALLQVPIQKRPVISDALMDFYAHRFPGYAVALCCFNTRQAKEGNPIMVWYPPMNPREFRAPAVDCHTGAIPDLRTHVEVDHWLFMSHYKMWNGEGLPVRYRDNIPASVRPLLPDQVIGAYLDGHEPNGDWGMEGKYVESGLRGLNHLTRLLPPVM